MIFDSILVIFVAPGVDRTSGVADQLVPPSWTWTSPSTGATVWPRRCWDPEDAGLAVACVQVAAGPARLLELP